MRIVLINPPHTAIGSRVPDDHLPPLGLLAVGGPLIDAGSNVRLIDAEFGPMSTDEIVHETLSAAPDLVLIGHSGSTSAHPTALEIAAAVKAAHEGVRIIYGGVFPTYHWKDIFEETTVFDVIVRGEGEATIVALVEAFLGGHSLSTVRGIAYREADGSVNATPPATTIADLDAYRIGWELIDHRRYTYWGGKRAVVMQFSRGCPHLCNYCGQRGFWTRWRHRSPEHFAKEIARLHREQGVELINLADENPTSSKKAWKAFLESHRWTPFFRIAKHRRVIQGDIRKWDYKHQVLEMAHFKPWVLFLCVKAIELAVQARPKAMARILFHKDAEQRHSMRWYTQMGRRVWFREIFQFLFRDRFLREPPLLEEFWGSPQDSEEEAMTLPPRKSAKNVVEPAGTA